MVNRKTPSFAGYENLGMDEPLPQGPPYYGYTKTEYEAMATQGVIPRGMPTTTPPKRTTEPFAGLAGNVEQAMEDFYAMTPEEQHQMYVEQGLTPEQITQQEAYMEAMAPTIPGAVTPTMPTAPPPMPEITPAPAYEISPEQQELQDLLATTITDWVESGGYGLPEEVQAQMIQQQTDSLKAREQENIRVMKNNMERRGITNSGFVFSNEQAIRSNTSVAIAGAIADVQIKSALIKMASFEKAMGAAGQFLGYLSEQSQLAYQPEFATWQAEQLATMQHWQAQMDILKIELNAAYQTQNTILQSQLTSQLNEQQHQYNLELAEIELEATNQASAAQGAGSIFGTIIEGLFSIFVK